MSKPIVIDSRKFLGIINNSAQSKVAVFESLVKQIGDKSGAKWRLAALSDANLFIEDCTNNAYYAASHRRLRGGRINISNIRPVKLVEEQKQTVFETNCRGLVDAIEANDQRSMRTAYNNLAAQRFSPYTVPKTGIVRTRDGITRKLRVESVHPVLDTSLKSRLIAALVESVQDNVVLQNGRVISATFGADRRKRLPVTEWTCRKVVGRFMRETAEKAYLSPGFQKRIAFVAKLIDEDRINEAVAGMKEFLREQQEFCLLNRAETSTLIENALAAKAIFNQQLCDDTATLFYRTNLKINRNTIIKEWQATAVKAQHPVLIENVSILAKAKDFETAYNKFIDLTFNEALSPRDEEIGAYTTALKLLRDSPKIMEDQELRSKVDELLEKLTDRNGVDDATVYLVRETLASAHKEIAAMEGLDTLSDYDQSQGGPSDNELEDQGEELGSEVGDDLGAAAGVGGGSGAPNIVINSPLIQIGGTSAAGESGGGEEPLDLGGDEGMDDLDFGDEGDEEGDEEEGGGDELGDLGLGDEGGGGEDELGLGEGGGAEKDVNINLDSKQKRGKRPLSEAQRIARKALGKTRTEGSDWFKKNVLDKKKDGEGEGESEESENETEGEEEIDECGTACESADPYAFGEDVDFNSVGSSYGRPVIKDEMEQVVGSMFKLVESRGLDKSKVLADPRQLAIAALKLNGLRIPEHRLNPTIESIIERFATIAEDQFKWGTKFRRRTRGVSDKNKIDQREGGKKTRHGGSSTSEHSGEQPEADAGISGSAPAAHSEGRVRRSIVWLEHDQKGQGIKGDLDGVKFVLDYANPPLVMSEDGNVEIPVPASLVPSAKAAIGLTEGNARPFARWLAAGIEQLRPLTEDSALEEAVATITASADGSIEVSVDGDVEVGEGGESELPMDVGGDVCEKCNMAMVDCECPTIPGSEEEEGTGTDGMQPVGDLGGEAGLPPQAETGDEGEAGGGEMPDFEGGDEEDEEVEEDAGAMAESVVVEDDDVTDPKGSGYDTTKDDHRKFPEVGKPPKKDDGKKLKGIGQKPKKSEDLPSAKMPKDITKPAPAPGKNRE